jgi:hypothetical protein
MVNLNLNDIIRECTIGSSTGVDTCYEVCGDSWNMG